MAGWQPLAKADAEKHACDVTQRLHTCFNYIRDFVAGVFFVTFDVEYSDGGCGRHNSDL